MNTPPHPYTWTTKHLQQLEAEARDLAAKNPSNAEIEAFTRSLVGDRYPHIASATFGFHGKNRIAVVLHGGLAFPIDIPAPPVRDPKGESPAVKVMA